MGFLDKVTGKEAKPSDEDVQQELKRLEEQAKAQRAQALQKLAGWNQEDFQLYNGIKADLERQTPDQSAFQIYEWLQEHLRLKRKHEVLEKELAELRKLVPPPE